MIYIIFILLFIIIGNIIYYTINRKKIQRHIEKIYLNKKRDEFNKQLQTEKQFVEDELLLQSKRLEEEKGRFDAALKKHLDDISLLEKKREISEDSYRKKLEEQEKSIQANKEKQLLAVEEMVNERKARVDVEVDAFREVEMQKARIAVSADTEANQKWAEATLRAYWDELAQITQEREQELAEVVALLDDYKKKQDVINEAILRQRAIDEQQDFFRVCLTDEAKQDIKYLVSIVDNIKNSALLYKLIWSEYIQKPFNTMLKNVTGGKEIKCVIYKITNINTQEIYIGKTKADVAKRWTEHIKTSLNIGTVARSKIHDALFRHWDEFTFEILEEVNDESKLSQREKYYINFYQSNIYGYNMNSGG